MSPAPLFSAPRQPEFSMVFAVTAWRSAFASERAALLSAPARADPSRRRCTMLSSPRPVSLLIAPAFPLAPVAALTICLGAFIKTTFVGVSKVSAKPPMACVPVAAAWYKSSTRAAVFFMASPSAIVAA